MDEPFDDHWFTKFFWLLIVFLGVVFSWSWGSRQGQVIGKQNIQNEAIERGFAEYNKQTGEWQWRDND